MQLLHPFPGQVHKPAGFGLLCVSRILPLLLPHWHHFGSQPPHFAATMVKWPLCHPVCASLQLVFLTVARELFLGKPVQSWNSPAWNAPFAAHPPQRNCPDWSTLTPLAPSLWFPLPSRMPSVQQCAFLPPDLCMCCSFWVAQSASPCFCLPGLIPVDLSDFGLRGAYLTGTCVRLLCARHRSKGFMYIHSFTPQKHKRKEEVSHFMDEGTETLVRQLFSLAHWLQGWARSQLFCHCLALDFDLYAVYLYTCVCITCFLNRHKYMLLNSKDTKYTMTRKSPSYPCIPATHQPSAWKNLV